MFKSSLSVPQGMGYTCSSKEFCIILKETYRFCVLKTLQIHLSLHLQLSPLLQYTKLTIRKAVREVATKKILDVIKVCCKCRLSNLRIGGSLEESIFENSITEVVVWLPGIILYLGRGEPVEPVMFFIVMNKSCEHTR